MADAKQVAEVLGIEAGKLGEAVPETLFKDGQGPLGELVDSLLATQGKVTELGEALEFQKGEAKKAFAARDELKARLRELEASGIKDEELKQQYQEATKSLATLEAERAKTSEELEGLRKFKASWEENTRAQVEAAIKQFQVSRHVAEMIRRMDLQDQLPFLQSTYGAAAGDGRKGEWPFAPTLFAGKKLPASGAPFEGFVTEEEYEQKKGDKEWVRENRERINRSVGYWG